MECHHDWKGNVTGNAKTAFDSEICYFVIN